jgi:hypothetical protein
MSRRYVLIAGALALGLTSARALVSCSEITPTTYGNPNTLDRKNLPGEGGVEALACSVDDGGEGGTFDGGCPSFATDIFPYLKPTGTWQCSNKACHGGTSAPPIDGTGAAACLASLQKITVKNQVYVAGDASTDDNAQSFLCNLQGSCGSPMPKAPGKTPTPAELCMIQAWLKCGAPK